MKVEINKEIIDKLKYCHLFNSFVDNDFEDKEPTKFDELTIKDIQYLIDSCLEDLPNNNDYWTGKDPIKIKMWEEFWNTKSNTGKSLRKLLGIKW